MAIVACVIVISRKSESVEGKRFLQEKHPTHPICYCNISSGPPPPPQTYVMIVIQNMKNV